MLYKNIAYTHNYTYPMCRCGMTNNFCRRSFRNSPYEESLTEEKETSGPESRDLLNYLVTNVVFIRADDLEISTKNKNQAM